MSTRAGLVGGINEIGMAARPTPPRLSRPDIETQTTWSQRRDAGEAGELNQARTGSRQREATNRSASSVAAALRPRGRRVTLPLFVPPNDDQDEGEGHRGGTGPRGCRVARIGRKAASAGGVRREHEAADRTAERETHAAHDLIEAHGAGSLV